MVKLALAGDVLRRTQSGRVKVTLLTGGFSRGYIRLRAYSIRPERVRRLYAIHPVDPLDWGASTILVAFYETSSADYDVYRDSEAYAVDALTRAVLEAVRVERCTRGSPCVVSGYVGPDHNAWYVAQEVWVDDRGLRWREVERHGPCIIDADEIECEEYW